MFGFIEYNDDSKQDVIDEINETRDLFLGMVDFFYPDDPDKIFGEDPLRALAMIKFTLMIQNFHINAENLQVTINNEKSKEN